MSNENNTSPNYCITFDELDKVVSKLVQEVKGNYNTEFWITVTTNPLNIENWKNQLDWHYDDDEYSNKLSLFTECQMTDKKITIIMSDSILTEEGVTIYIIPGLQVPLMFRVPEKKEIQFYLEEIPINKI